VETVSENFASSSGTVKAHMVQNVKIFLAPDKAIPARTVAHLPSHSKGGATSVVMTGDDDADTDADSESERIEGDAFETANWQADEVSESDSLMEDADMESEAETVDGESVAQPRFAQAAPTSAPTPAAAAAAPVKAPPLAPGATLPIRQLQDALHAYNAELPRPLPSDSAAPAKPAALAAAPAPVVAAPPKRKRKVNPFFAYDEDAAMDKAEADGSARGPNGEVVPDLPGGFDVKPHVDRPPFTAARAKFPNRSLKLPANCPGTKCSRRTPVMVGYVGYREQPASSTRRVRVPGLDHKIIKSIHNDLKTTRKTTWLQADLDRARKHLSRSTRRIDKLRTVRKALENASLNRKVYTK